MEMEAVANIFDKNGDGFIDYKEFVAALRPDTNVSYVFWSHFLVKKALYTPEFVVGYSLKSFVCFVLLLLLCLFNLER